MSLSLKIFMVVTSICTFAYMVRKIRKAQAQITDMGFWVCFSMALIIMAAFPETARYMADLLGVISLMNFVFLAVIFLLLIELFLVSVKVSKLESKIIELAGSVAIYHKKSDESEEVKPAGSGMECEEI